VVDDNLMSRSFLGCLFVCLFSRGQISASLLPCTKGCCLVVMAACCWLLELGSCEGMDLVDGWMDGF
jgi:hypothetical protein